MKCFEDLIKKHQFIGVQFEQYLYRVADHFSKEYAEGNGAYWKSYEVEDVEQDGFYCVFDDDRMYNIRNFQNGYDKGDMDSKTFSLAIWSFALNMFGFKLYEDGKEDIASDYFDLFHYAQAHALEILGDEEKHSQYYWFLD